ncbi:hypothetical protein D3C85_1128960 [compost metagenome]
MRANHQPGGQVQGQWLAQGVSPHGARGACRHLLAKAAHGAVVAEQKLLDRRQCIGAVLQVQFALPAPGPSRVTTLAQMQEVGAVLAKLRLRRIAGQGRAIGAEPVQSLDNAQIGTPQVGVEPQQVQARFQAGEGRALQLQALPGQTIVLAFLIQAQAGAEQAVLVAPQVALKAQAIKIALAAAAHSPARQLRLVVQLVEVKRVGPGAIGDAVVEAVAAAVAGA